MKYLSVKELLLTLAITASVFFCTNFFAQGMPSMVQMFATGMLVVVVGLFALYIVFEKTTDEREAHHRDIAGRVGYTAGILCITVAILIATIRHSGVDPMLPITLLVMIVSKIAARVYARKYL